MLTKTRSMVLPLAYLDGGGALISIVIFEAQYPARCSPCQRLDSGLSTVTP